jgi:hypothetical protein
MIRGIGKFLASNGKDCTKSLQPSPIKGTNITIAAEIVIEIVSGGKNQLKCSLSGY